MSARTLILITIACVILVVAGFLIDAKGFLVNLVAGAISIIITVTLVEWLLERQRKRQWGKAREQIINALLWHLGNITSEYATHFHNRAYDLVAFSEETGVGYHKADPRTARALRSMLKLMENGSGLEGSLEQAQEVYKVIEPELTQIRDTLLPRILAIEVNEPELVTLLGSLDNAHRNWMNQIVLDREVMAGDQFGAAVDTFRAVTDVYEYLVQQAAKIPRGNGDDGNQAHTKAKKAD